MADTKTSPLPGYVWLWLNEQGELQVSLKKPDPPIVCEYYIAGREHGRVMTEEAREAAREARAASEEAYWKGNLGHDFGSY